VITDLGMPKMEGDDLAREIRRRYPDADIYIILRSAHYNKELFDQLIRSGIVNRALSKMDQNWEDYLRQAEEWLNKAGSPANDEFLQEISRLANDQKFVEAIAVLWRDEDMQYLYQKGYVTYSVESDIVPILVEIIVTNPDNPNDSRCHQIFKRNLPEGKFTYFYSGDNVSFDTPNVDRFIENIKVVMGGKEGGEKQKLLEWAGIVKERGVSPDSSPALFLPLFSVFTGAFAVPEAVNWLSTPGVDTVLSVVCGLWTVVLFGLPAVGMAANSRLQDKRVQIRKVCPPIIIPRPLTSQANHEPETRFKFPPCLPQISRKENESLQGVSSALRAAMDNRDISALRYFLYDSGRFSLKPRLEKRRKSSSGLCDLQPSWKLVIEAEGVILDIETEQLEEAISQRNVKGIERILQRLMQSKIISEDVFNEWLQEQEQDVGRLPVLSRLPGLFRQAEEILYGGNNYATPTEEDSWIYANRRYNVAAIETAVAQLKGLTGWAVVGSVRYRWQGRRDNFDDIDLVLIRGPGSDNQTKIYRKYIMGFVKTLEARDTTITHSQVFYTKQNPSYYRIVFYRVNGSFHVDVHVYATWLDQWNVRIREYEGLAGDVNKSGRLPEGCFDLLFQKNNKPLCYGKVSPASLPRPLDDGAKLSDPVSERIKFRPPTFLMSLCVFIDPVSFSDPVSSIGIGLGALAALPFMLPVVGSISDRGQQSSKQPATLLQLFKKLIRADRIPEHKSKASAALDANYEVDASTCSACLLLGDRGEIGVVHIDTLALFGMAAEDWLIASDPDLSKEAYLRATFEKVLPQDANRRQFSLRKALILLPKTPDYALTCLKELVSMARVDVEFDHRFLIRPEDVETFLRDHYPQDHALDIRQSLYNTEPLGGIHTFYRSGGQALVAVSRREVYKVTPAELTFDQYDLNQDNFDTPLWSIAAGEAMPFARGMYSFLSGKSVYKQSDGSAAILPLFGFVAGLLPDVGLECMDCVLVGLAALPAVGMVKDSASPPGSEKFFRKLGLDLSSPDSAIRKKAAQSFDEQGASKCHKVYGYIRALSSPDYTARQEATQALKKLGVSNERMVYVYKAILSSHNPAVRKESAQALGKLGDECTIKPLYRCLLDGDSDVYQAAAEALNQLGITNKKISRYSKRKIVSLRIRLAFTREKIGYLAFDYWDSDYDPPPGPYGDNNPGFHWRHRPNPTHQRLSAELSRLRSRANWKSEELIIDLAEFIIILIANAIVWIFLFSYDWEAQGSSVIPSFNGTTLSTITTSAVFLSFSMLPAVGMAVPRETSSEEIITHYPFDRADMPEDCVGLFLPVGGLFGHTQTWDHLMGLALRGAPHIGLDWPYYLTGGSGSYIAKAIGVGRPVKAVSNGRVVFASAEEKIVIVDCGGIADIAYGHIEPAVRKGDDVVGGKTIVGAISFDAGDVSPHLHLGVALIGEQGRRVYNNPLSFGLLKRRVKPLDGVNIGRAGVLDGMAVFYGEGSDRVGDKRRRAPGAGRKKSTRPERMLLLIAGEYGKSRFNKRDCERLWDEELTKGQWEYCWAAILDNGWMEPAVGRNNYRLTSQGVRAATAFKGQNIPSEQPHPITSAAMLKAAERFSDEPQVRDGFLHLAGALEILEQHLRDTVTAEPEIISDFHADDVEQFDRHRVVAYRKEIDYCTNMYSWDIKKLLADTPYNAEFVSRHIHLHESCLREEEAIQAQAQDLRKKVASPFSKEFIDHTFGRLREWHNEELLEGGSAYGLLGSRILHPAHSIAPRSPGPSGRSKNIIIVAGGIAWIEPYDFRRLSDTSWPQDAIVVPRNMKHSNEQHEWTTGTIMALVSQWLLRSIIGKRPFIDFGCGLSAIFGVSSLVIKDILRPDLGQTCGMSHNPDSHNVMGEVIFIDRVSDICVEVREYLDSFGIDLQVAGEIGDISDSIVERSVLAVNAEGLNYSHALLRNFILNRECYPAVIIAAIGKHRDVRRQVEELLRDKGYRYYLLIRDSCRPISKEHEPLGTFIAFREDVCGDRDISAVIEQLELEDKPDPADIIRGQKWGDLSVAGAVPLSTRVVLSGTSPGADVPVLSDWSQVHGILQDAPIVSKLEFDMALRAKDARGAFRGMRRDGFDYAFRDQAVGGRSQERGVEWSEGATWAIDCATHGPLSQGGQEGIIFWISREIRIRNWLEQMGKVGPIPFPGVDGSWLVAIDQECQDHGGHFVRLAPVRLLAGVVPGGTSLESNGVVPRGTSPRGRNFRIGLEDYLARHQDAEPLSFDGKTLYYSPVSILSEGSGRASEVIEYLPWGQFLLTEKSNPLATRFYEGAAVAIHGDEKSDYFTAWGMSMETILRAIHFVEDESLLVISCNNSSMPIFPGIPCVFGSNFITRGLVREEDCYCLNIADDEDGISQQIIRGRIYEYCVDCEGFWLRTSPRKKNGRPLLTPVFSHGSVSEWTARVLIKNSAHDPGCRESSGVGQEGDGPDDLMDRDGVVPGGTSPRCFYTGNRVLAETVCTLEEMSGGERRRYSRHKMGDMQAIRVLADQLCQRIDTACGPQIVSNPADWVLFSGPSGFPRNNCFHLGNIVADSLGIQRAHIERWDYEGIYVTSSPQTKLEIARRVHYYDGSVPLLQRFGLFVDDCITSGAIMQVVNELLLAQGMVTVAPFALVGIDNPGMNSEFDLDRSALTSGGLDVIIDILANPENVFTSRMLLFLTRLTEDELIHIFSRLSPERLIELRESADANYLPGGSPAVDRILRLSETEALSAGTSPEEEKRED